MTTIAKPDLNFAQADTLYASHGLHAFAAKCPPQLARWCIEQFSEPGDCVVDPFVGSGTTLVEARLIGRNSVGVDIDPLACLITQVKVEPLDDAALARVGTWIKARAAEVAKTEADNLTLPPIHNRERWFLPEVSSALAALKRAIDELDEPPALRRFCYLAFSSLIVARTSVANARDLAHSRHHYRSHITTPDVLKRFEQRCAIMRRQLAALGTQIDRTTSAHVVRADARALPLRDETAQLVVTSPPYCNAIDYTRTHAFAVGWLADVLDTSVEDYRRLGRRYIGTDRGGQNGRPPDGRTPSTTAESAIACVEAADCHRAGFLRRYFADMRQSLGECARILVPGGHLVIVVCPSRIREVTIETHTALSEIAQALDIPFELVEQHERVLDDRRRVMPYLQARFGPRMRTEYVLVLRRQ